MKGSNSYRPRKKICSFTPVAFLSLDKPAIPTINHTSVPRYGEAVTLTCNSSSTTYPKYYRPLLTWSYTWYRNGSVVYDKATYTFTVRRDNMYDVITCRVHEVLYSDNSTAYKIDMNIIECKDLIANIFCRI